MSRPAVRSLGGLAVALARQWWPQLAALAVTSGVVATAMTGALGVGDGIRGGLGRLAVERLGRIDAVVLADGFVRRDLAAELAAGGGEPRLACTPAVVMPVTVAAGARRGAVAAATLLACDDPAALGFVPPAPPLEADAVFVNGVLAAAAGIAAGDEIVLRLPVRASVPADSPLGRRTNETVGRRLRVKEVLPERGLGRFSLRPSLAPEPLVVVALAEAQAMLRAGDVANAVFVVGDGSAAVAATAARRLRPRLSDLGTTLEPLPDRGLRLTSAKLVVPPEIDRAAERVLAAAGGRPTLVLLATSLAAERGRAAVPYSTVLGIGSTTLPAGPLVDAAGATLPLPAADEILINRWLADDLAAQGTPVAVGDALVMTTFEPETIHGRVEERTDTFRIAGVAEMRGGAVDPTLVPDVEGVTDEASIADWDPPFPFDAERVRTVPPHDEDDRYWKEHRATPKAFIALEAARRIGGSRFGRTTAWHVPEAAGSPDELSASLAAAIDPAQAGIRVVPLRSDALEAARGSTPFGGLFLALSMFVVAAGVMLVGLLFGLLVTAQRRTIGTLSAVGFAPRRLTALLVIVGGLAAAIGIAVGTALGPLWARLLLAWLGRAWERSVVAGSAEVFAAPSVSWTSLAAGAAGAFAAAVASVALAARRAGSLPPLALLRGSAGRRAGRIGRGAALVGGGVALAAAVGLALVASRGAATAAVGLFFAAGAAALVALLAAVWAMLVGSGRRPAVRTLPALAGRLLAAQPGRAFAIAAIVACGQFLVVAVSAFAVREPIDAEDRRSPTGGWTTIATFGEPTSVDPLDAGVRAGLGLTPDQDRALARCGIALVRSTAGDDASCTNLYATTQPTVIGVGPSFIDRDGFRFADHAPLAADGRPWRLLDEPRADGAVPAVLDQATAQWGLKLGGLGARFTVADEAGVAVPAVVVGLLEPGILQGRVIVAEREFQRLFPSRSGYALALVDATPLDAAARAALPDTLRTVWADAGVSLESTTARLRALQAVQNTFLAGFQALGTLGLLLGTAGVAAVRAQGVAERIGSLSVLRAVGFGPWRIRGLLVLETLAAVGAGIGAGTLAALLAVWPALAGGAARVPTAWAAGSAGLTLAAAVGAAAWATARMAIPERPRSG